MPGLQAALEYFVRLGFGAKSDTQSLCTPANGEGDGRGNVKQEHVFNGNQRAKCETRERRGGKMGRWTQKAPQKPSGNRHAWCAQAALRERLPATAQRKVTQSQTPIFSAGADLLARESFPDLRHGYRVFRSGQLTSLFTTIASATNHCVQIMGV